MISPHTYKQPFSPDSLTFNMAKESGIKLSEDEEERLKLLNSLPKNEWIDLDKNGNPIGNEIAENQQKEKLKKFKIQ